MNAAVFTPNPPTGAAATGTAINALSGAIFLARITASRNGNGRESQNGEHVVG